MHFTGHDGIGVVGKQCVADAELDSEFQAFAAIAPEPRLETDLPTLEVRSPSNALDPGRRHCLQPHRLPDAGRARIPDGMRLDLPVLFASRLRKVGWVVERSNRNDNPVLADERTEIDGEWRIPAFVRRGFAPVDPHFCRIIHGSEMKQHLMTGRCRADVDRPAVPRDAVKARVADAACGGFGSERNLDAVRPIHVIRVIPDAFGIDGELPRAVEGGPGAALQLRTRVSVTSETFLISAGLL